MQGCSFKMVRQELPECTQRQSRSQDGEKEGEGEKAGGQGSDPRPMWKRINSCFPCSFAVKLLRCNYSYCKIMGVSALIAPLRENESCC